MDNCSDNFVQDQINNGFYTEPSDKTLNTLNIGENFHLKELSERNFLCGEKCKYYETQSELSAT